MSVQAFECCCGIRNLGSRKNVGCDAATSEVIPFTQVTRYSLAFKSNVTGHDCAFDSGFEQGLKRTLNLKWGSPGEHAYQDSSHVNYQRSMVLGKH